MPFDEHKAPFPWFGGKSKAANTVWSALGDPKHYVEPFAGSLAVLLNRPHEANRAYYSETVNDADGLLVNAWRSIQLSPHATADACSWPVAEADLMARHLAIVRWRAERDLQRLQADPKWHDPEIAGWWLYGICAWIGGEWCAGTGPWTVRDGRVFKQGRAKKRKPGVKSVLPHLNNDGQGVHSPQLREPGVKSGLPHLHDGGKGVHSPQLREPGVKSVLPYLTSDGKGVHSPQLREPAPHGLVMPRLLRWFELLSTRLRHVRICNGDWKRVVTRSTAQTLSCKASGDVGIFLDPPYSHGVRDSDIYSVESASAAAECLAWCKSAPDHWRIVLAGYDTEHTELEAKGWRCVEWYQDGFLTGGMGNTSGKSQQNRERLWLSPSCLGGDTAPQMGLFDEGES